MIDSHNAGAFKCPFRKNKLSGKELIVVNMRFPLLVMRCDVKSEQHGLENIDASVESVCVYIAAGSLVVRPSESIVPIDAGNCYCTFTKLLDRREHQTSTVPAFPCVHACRLESHIRCAEAFAL
eukprot:109905-Amphidinium_carterae.1